MIIHPPFLTETKQHFRVSATIDWENRPRGVPTTLWFQFSKQITPSTDFDPFVVALLLVAMKKGENISVKGSLSGKLVAGIKQYQRLYHSWFPNKFREIAILTHSLRTDSADQNQVNACAFSGGVDSFYTFISERHQLGSALFMAGFDMPLHLTKSIGELTHSYSRMGAELGINLITGSTNVRAFVNTVDWTNSHGQALAASALFFKNHWSQFFVPSSYLENSYPKWGTHPDLDPLLSTETMKFVHHGENANRVQKLIQISKSSLTYERLRVCWIQDIGLRNCSSCEKCIRTMTALKIIGKLRLYRTFGKFKLKKIWSLSQRTHQGRLFARELMWEALIRGKLVLWSCLAYSLLMRNIFFFRLKKRKST